MRINKDQVKGRTDTARDKTKEVSGKIASNAKPEAEGHTRKNVGESRAKNGDAKQHLSKS